VTTKEASRRNARAEPLQLSREAAADVHHRGRSQNERPEIHAAIKLLQQAGLLHDPEMEDKPNLSALEEFLLHGVKYAFPAVPSEVTRGLLTPVPRSLRRMPQVMNFLRRWRDGETQGSLSNLIYMTVPQRLSAIRFSTSHSPWSTQSGMGGRASGKWQRDT
jgi:hypothetical protein